MRYFVYTFLSFFYLLANSLALIYFCLHTVLQKPFAEILIVYAFSNLTVVLFIARDYLALLVAKFLLGVKTIKYKFDREDYIAFIDVTSNLSFLGFLITLSAFLATKNQILLYFVFVYALFSWKVIVRFFKWLESLK